MEDNKTVVEDNDNRNFDLTSFARAKEKMIATNENAYQGVWDVSRGRLNKLRDYTRDEVLSVIATGSLIEQQKLSRNYFNKDGYYKQIIIYYATLLKYMGLLIPNPSVGKNLSTSHIQKRYYNALDYVERMRLPVLLTNIAQRALVDGCYYGIKIEADKNTFQLIDLPSGYACSRFKDINGNDIVEFDLSYFNTIIDKEQRRAALAAYPKIVQKAWKEFSTGRRASKWVIIPKDLGVCFPFFEGRPLFLNVIPATIEYDEAIGEQREREAEEVRKIIVQTIPHLSDGRLLFEPDEAEQIHNGTVQMMKGNKNVSVLTSYGDVDAITSSGASAEKVDNTLSRLEQNIYAQAGTTGQVFASTGSSSLETSLNNDLALMMYFANKVSGFITNTLNDIFGNGNVTFKYTIMPITYYNTSSFVDSTFKLVGSGYSALMPALAFGLTQKDLVNIKELENDVLKLGDKLKPLSTSYTQSKSDSDEEEDGAENGEGKAPKQKPTNTDIDEGGRPKKKEDEKTEKTHKNEESLDRTGGGS